MSPKTKATFLLILTVLAIGGTAAAASVAQSGYARIAAILLAVAAAAGAIRHAYWPDIRQLADGSSNPPGTPGALNLDGKQSVKPPTPTLPRRMVFAGLLCMLMACKNPAAAENAVFTVENYTCMVVNLLGGVTTGTVQAVAASLGVICKIDPSFTEAIIDFVNAFNALSPEQKEAFKQTLLKGAKK